MSDWGSQLVAHVHAGFLFLCPSTETMIEAQMCMVEYIFFQCNLTSAAMHILRARPQKQLFVDLISSKSAGLLKNSSL